VAITAHHRSEQVILYQIKILKQNCTNFISNTVGCNCENLMLHFNFILNFITLCNHREIKIEV